MALASFSKSPRKAIPKTKVLEIKAPAHRARPGSIALREIRHYQSKSCLVLRRAPFQRLVRSILEDFSDHIQNEGNLLDTKDGQQNFRMTRDALLALQEATEAFMVRMMDSAHQLAHHAKRKTLFVRDLQLLERLWQHEFPVSVPFKLSHGTQSYVPRMSWRERAAMPPAQRLNVQSGRQL